MNAKLLTVLIVAALMTACVPLQGPDVDLHTIATPDPVPEAQALPQPAPGPSPGHGQWRAWIPKQVSPAGDVTEGHWMMLSTEPPVIEMEPTKPIPRVPKPTLGKTPALAHQPQPGSGQPPQVRQQQMTMPTMPQALEQARELMRQQQRGGQ